MGSVRSNTEDVAEFRSEKAPHGAFLQKIICMHAQLKVSWEILWVVASKSQAK